MSRGVGIALLLAVSACTSADAPSVAAQENGLLRVSLVEDYYWPSPAANGEGPEVEVFPLVTALVVDRRDGRPLAPRDEAASREAARAYCDANGQRFPAEAPARLSGGAWAFPPCQAALQ